LSLRDDNDGVATFLGAGIGGEIDADEVAMFLGAGIGGEVDDDGDGLSMLLGAETGAAVSQGRTNLKPGAGHCVDSRMLRANTSPLTGCEDC